MDRPTDLEKVTETAKRYAEGGYGIDTLISRAYLDASAERDRYKAALEFAQRSLANLYEALQRDSREKDILSDTVEYHLDGQTMYHAINGCREARMKIKETLSPTPPKEP